MKVRHCSYATNVFGCWPHVNQPLQSSLNTAGIDITHVSLVGVRSK